MGKQRISTFGPPPPAEERIRRARELNAELEEDEMVANAPTGPDVFGTLPEPGRPRSEREALDRLTVAGSGGQTQGRVMKRAATMIADTILQQISRVGETVVEGGVALGKGLLSVALPWTEEEKKELEAGAVESMKETGMSAVRAAGFGPLGLDQLYDIGALIAAGKKGTPRYFPQREEPLIPPLTPPPETQADVWGDFLMQFGIMALVGKGAVGRSLAMQRAGIPASMANVLKESAPFYGVPIGEGAAAGAGRGKKAKVSVGGEPQGPPTRVKGAGEGPVPRATPTSQDLGISPDTMKRLQVLDKRLVADVKEGRMTPDEARATMERAVDVARGASTPPEATQPLPKRTETGPTATAEAPKVSEAQPAPKRPATGTAEPPTATPRGATGGPGAELTAQANRVVDAQREARGRPPLMSRAHGEHGAVWDATVRAAQDDPLAGTKLVDDLQTKQRGLQSREEAAMLDYEMIKRKQVYDDAARQVADAHASGDAGRLSSAQEAFNKAEVLYDQACEVARSTGTVWSEIGNWRQQMIAEDDSLAGMIEKAQAKLGGKLTPEQIAFYEGLAKRIDALQKEYADYAVKVEAERASAEAGQAAFREADQQRIATLEKALADTEKRLSEAEAKAKQGPPAAKAKPKTPAQPRERSRFARNKLMTPERMDAAKAELRSILAEMSSGVMEGLTAIPAHVAKMIPPLAKMAFGYLEAGTQQLAAFTADVVGEFGDVVKDAAQKAWDLAMQKAAPAIRSKLVGAMKGKQATTLMLERVTRKFMRTLDLDTLRNRDAAVDAVHSFLKEAYPNITRSEAQRAMAGYGIYRPLTTDAVELEILKRRGELQEISKLEDYEAGRAALKTGAARPEPTQEKRALAREVGAAKAEWAKKHPEEAAKESQGRVRTALQAVKTRLKNQIDDLEDAISSGERLKGGKKGGVDYDTEAMELRARRDELRAQYDEAFGRPGLTDAQRIAAAKKMLEKSIADYEQRLATGDLTPPKKPSLAIETPELAELRARRDALAKRLAEEREALKPKLTPAQKQKRSWWRRKESEAEQLKKVAKEGAPPPRPEPPPLDAQQLRMQAQIDQLKMAANERTFNDMLKKRTLGQKVAAGITEAFMFPRAFITAFDLSAPLRQGGIFMLSHPIRSLKSFKTMFKALPSNAAFYEQMSNLYNRRNAPLYRRAGLSLTGVGFSLKDMEEAHMSRMASKVPGVGHSQRAFTAYLNNLRADMFDSMAATLSKSGVPTDVELRAIANYINVATTRGGGKRFASALAGLNTVFFAPRMLASRIQFLTGQPFYHGTARTRVLILKEYLRYGAGLLTVLGAAKAAGYKVNFSDPTEADWLKVKIPGKDRDTYVDFAAGLTQVFTFGARSAMSLAGDEDEQRRYGNTVLHFVRSKLSPQVGAGANWFFGKTLNYEPVTVGGTAQELFIPLFFKDVEDAVKESSLPEGVALSVLALLGAGMRTRREPPEQTPTARPPAGMGIPDIRGRIRRSIRP